MSAIVFIHIYVFLQSRFIIQDDDFVILKIGTSLCKRLQSSQMGSVHDLHQYFASTVRSSRLQNKQYLTDSFSELIVIVHILLFSGILFAQSSPKISFLGSCTRCQHTGQLMTFNSFSLTPVIELDV